MSAPTASGRRGARPRRLDALDGLRTIAVLLVVAFHVSLPGLSGGYLGVDVFFVLSGFLITSLLLREVNEHGRIDLGRFWTRRLLRLMPASLLVITSVMLWGLFVAEPYRRPSLGADALWSLLYVGNWRFISSSGYFADDGTSSPLLHVWSLAVEEQFYLVWPLLLTLVAAVVLRTRAHIIDASTGTARPLDSSERFEAHARRRRRMASATLILALALAALSVFLLSWWFEPTSPDRAYMGTDSKIFEPLLGAAAAALMIRPRWRAQVGRHAQLLMVAGLAGVVAGVVFLGGPHPFYFSGGALLFSICTVVLVMATTLADRRHGLSLFLGSTPMAYLGRISYGIYLWHWPLAVWIVDGHGFSPRRAALAVALTIALAALSYHLVETPIRTGRLARVRPLRVVPIGASALAVCLGVCATLGGTPLAAVVPASAAANRGDASTVVLVGDSVIRRLMPAISPAGERRGLTVLGAARGGCPALGVVALDGQGTPIAEGRCGRVVPSEQERVVKESNPGLVIWWSRYELADRLGPNGARLRAGSPAFWAAQRADLATAIARLTANGAHLVFVETDRVGTGLASRCTPTSCDPFLLRLRDENELREKWNRILRENAAANPRVSVITMDDVYCRDEENPCDDRLPVSQGDQRPAPDGSGVARPDGSHFSQAAMPAVAEALLERALASQPH